MHRTDAGMLPGLDLVDFLRIRRVLEEDRKSRIARRGRFLVADRVRRPLRAPDHDPSLRVLELRHVYEGSPLVGHSLASARSSLQHQPLATAPPSRAQARRIHVPDRRATLHGYATTAHHVLPSSSHPHLFFAPGNVVAACARCNSGQGAEIAAGNRRAASERIAELEQANWDLEKTIEQLEHRCEELGLALAAATNNTTDAPARKPARSAVL